MAGPDKVRVLVVGDSGMLSKNIGAPSSPRRRKVLGAISVLPAFSILTDRICSISVHARKVIGDWLSCAKLWVDLVFVYKLL